jgi:hypothetical protein
MAVDHRAELVEADRVEVRETQRRRFNQLSKIGG